MRCTLLFLILVFSGYLGLKAQVNTSGSGISVEGFVTNSEGKYIENVHVVNISDNKGTTSNREGQFSINVFPGDTMRFTGVGYIPYTYHVPADRQSPVIPLHIVMLSDTIQITGINIYPWPADAAAFKEAILAMEDQTPKVPDLKLNDPKYKASGLPPGSPPTTIPGMANPGLTYTIKGPITTLYDAFSKEAKSQRKYVELVKADQKKVVAARRYNPEVVKLITHFTSDKEIQDFMLYCNLSVDFIISSSEYDLYKAIHECLLAYNEGKRDKI
jgi:hypothetical protein